MVYNFYARLPQPGMVSTIDIPFRFSVLNRARVSNPQCHPYTQTLVKIKINKTLYFFLKHFSGQESGILEFDWLLTRVPPVQFFPIRTGFVMDH